METWKAVKDYEGLYEVSDLGRVRSLDRTVRGPSRCPNGLRLKGKIMKSGLNSKGYLHISLQQEGESSIREIQRLVLIAFRGDPPEGHEAAHEDGNRLDNRLANLRWKTQQENTDDKFRHGTVLAGDCHPRAILSSGQALFARNMMAAGVSATWMAEAMNVGRASLYNIKYGRSWAVGV